MKLTAIETLDAHVYAVVQLAEEADREEQKPLCTEVLILARRLKAATETYLWSKK